MKLEMFLESVMTVVGLMFFGMTCVLFGKVLTLLSGVWP